MNKSLREIRETERVNKAKDSGNERMSGLKRGVKELVTCCKERIRGI